MAFSLRRWAYDLSFVQHLELNKPLLMDSGLTVDGGLTFIPSWDIVHAWS